MRTDLNSETRTRKLIHFIINNVINEFNTHKILPYIHKLALTLSSNVRMLSRVVRSGAMLSVLKDYGGIFLLLSVLKIIFDLHLISNDTIFLMYMYHSILFTYMPYAYNNYRIVYGIKKIYTIDTVYCNQCNCL